MSVQQTDPIAEQPDPRPITPPPGPFDVALRVPGSKSLTNRHLVLAALAGGTTVLEHPLRADDCDRLCTALALLGARVRTEADRAVIEGTGGRFQCGGAIDLGDGGTPSRFMIAAALLARAPVTIDGSPRMRERPVAEGLHLIRQLGATVQSLGVPDHLPVRITPPARCRGGVVEAPAMRSGQFVSALMLVAPWLDDGIDIRLRGGVTSPSYIELSAAALRARGAVVELALDVPEPFVRVAPGPVIGDGMVAIEPDASSAAYFAVAAAVHRASHVTLVGLPRTSIQPDAAVLGIVERAGAVVDSGRDGPVPWTRVSHRAGPRPLSFDASRFPDGALACAALAARATGPTRIDGLHTLVHKESDRLAALSSELARIGIRTKTAGDSIEIDPGAAHPHPAVIETWNDHRIAMTFAVIGLVRPGISIRDPGCVAKSYPGFWSDLDRLVER